ncbi:MBL fold metallo-hydrolase, partial [Klebsiella pneumoniae]|nr:MBL fold metallo-hydrolase [Klebsiella pneumoniae]
DIVHFPHIQLLDPEVTIAFDFDPLLAQETRIRLLEKVCAEQILVAGMHFDTAGFARIKKFSSGYQIIPADGINSQSHAAVDPEIRMPP